jgi:CRP-like cAMP-binding protein
MTKSWPAPPRDQAINPLLAKLGRCCVLDDADRAKLEAISARRIAVGAHKDIIRECDKPDDVHLVMEGLACRYKMMPGGRRAIMALMLPGDFCDLDVAILSHMDHTIGTLTPCSLVEIPRATVNELVDQHPHIARALRWATLVDEAVLREWLANTGQRAADRQMAHLLCELRVRLAVVGLADANGMHLPMTQQDLGDTLGISTVHVNRVLQQLKELDLVRLQGRDVLIPDLARLERFGEFNPDYLHLRHESGAITPI